MLFNSMEFLIFFPIVVLIYFVIPHKIRYIWLLAASYFYYMCWNPKYAILMLLSTVITYLSGILISRANLVPNKLKAVKLKKLFVGFCFSSNLIILFFFKYFDFFISNINLVLRKFNFELLNPQFDIILPVGISFYTFQALSYTMDIYREELKPEKNFLKYALFVSFFPQLVAGPIERSKNLIHQISERHYFEYNRVKNGLLLMLWGFVKKLIIADRLAILVNQVYNNYHDYKGLVLILATIFFSFQIYCDFSSYSDIASGAAQVMGFKLMDNFKQPYFSKSVAEFWRRWHISLSTWFRDYLYIPLGGNRVSKLKGYFNIMVVFAVSGLWHGADWSFVMWGAMNGAYQIIGKELKFLFDKAATIFKVNRESKLHILLKIITTYLLICFSWIFFRADNFSMAIQVIKEMVMEFNPWILTDGTLYQLGLDEKNFRLAIIGIIILLVFDYFNAKQDIRERLGSCHIVFRWSVYYLTIFSIIIFGVYGLGYDASQFIYFQF
ncbi:MBOAT family O-acyltransferase [Anaerosacchariphilus polymeriproducens]|uniref:MBOAT family protein n=1 Tax=Anaerosacchariphilus polymeriproducens TaxID=1812858 RepID=A0A371AUF4_9FIRM|nr:MBOAT family O-acyltransferase [Anaerosacchariphilus polymeriproducens]RDU23206.1 MBOAT family protein [Anaerosacchariphilus polymeriproducens]